jgi:hypothetical protein
MTAAVRRIKLSDIISDIDLQSRASIDSATVEDYAQVPDADFPPIIVFEDPASPSAYWPGDGWHRVLAAHKRGQYDIAADIRTGTRRDALLFSCGANATHGLHRTAADKRRAVQRLLDDTEWSKWSNVAIATAASVSAPFVLSLRKSLEDSGKIKPTETRTGTDGKQRPAKRPDVAPKRDNMKRYKSAGEDAPAVAPPAKKPHVAPVDADMPERYEDNEGNEVPETLYPVWQRLDDYMRIANRIRESGVTEALAELKAIGVELGDKDTMAFADEAIEKIRLIVNGVKQRAPAFVRGEGWSSLYTEFMESGESDE